MLVFKALSKYFLAPPKEIVKDKSEPEQMQDSEPKTKAQPKLIAKSESKPLVSKQEINQSPSKEISPLSPGKIHKDTLQKFLPKNIEFPKSKSEILPVSYPDLDRLAFFLKKNPLKKVKIAGHTDNLGSSEENLLLSERRAKKIAAYLIKQGVQRQQISSAIGYGDTMPIAKDDGRKYHPENRRVEFIFE